MTLEGAVRWKEGQGRGREGGRQGSRSQQKGASFKNSKLVLSFMIQNSWGRICF